MNYGKKTELKPIYLDVAGTSKPDKDIIKAISHYMTQYWHNPSSIYESGRNVLRAIEDAKARMGSILNCDPDELYFTNSGTQANNWALSMAFQNDMRIYTSSMEHPSVTKMFQKGYEQQNPEGMALSWIKNNSLGQIDLQWIEKKLSRDYEFKATPFVSLMLVNNETGIINDIRSISRIVHKFHGWMHTDISQAIGHMGIDLKELGADLCTFSSHKMGMPKGLGVLYVNKAFPISPLTYGGKQQNGMVAGTENQSYILAMADQLEKMYSTETCKERLELERIASITLRKAIADVCDELGCEVLFNAYQDITVRHANNILSVRFKGIDNQKLLTMLDLHNVQCSAGSACSAGERQPSQVLIALGMGYEGSLNTIRFSFDYRLELHEIYEFKDRLRSCLAMLMG